MKYLSEALSCAPARSAYTPDLKRHHGQCEINFHLCSPMLNKLYPLKVYRDLCLTKNGQEEGLGLVVRVAIIDQAPYTTTVEFHQKSEGCRYLDQQKLIVRLYHDVKMAEVVAWNNHRNWLPVYAYPNHRMNHPDEKIILNQFLGEWLLHCSRYGKFSDEV